VRAFGELAKDLFDEFAPLEETETLVCAERFRKFKLMPGCTMSGEDVDDLDPKGDGAGELDVADETWSFR